MTGGGCVSENAKFSVMQYMNDPQRLKHETLITRWSVIRHSLNMDLLGSEFKHSMGLGYNSSPDVI